MRAKHFLKEQSMLPYGSEPMGQDPQPAAPNANQPPTPIATQPAEPTETQETVKKYADSNQIKTAIAELTPLLSGAVFKNEAGSPTSVKKVRHIRILNTSVPELNAACTQWGASTTPSDRVQKTVSGKYLALSFEKDGITYTFVVTGKGRGAIAQKALSPTKLTLAVKDKLYSRAELIRASHAAVKSHIKDQSVQSMLAELINIATNGGSGSLTPDSQTVLAEIYNAVNQDFGEILAPIIMMKDNDLAEFPVGNHPLTDVTIGSKKYSIKSLSGSGTSFRSIATLMDKFESTIVQDQHKKELYKPLAELHPKKGGTNLDKIIRACNVARTPEYEEIIKVLGVNNLKDFDNLKEVLGKKIKQMDYRNFLTTFEKASRAGGWKRFERDKLPQMLGFPADSAYVLGYTNKKPEKEGGAAGEPSYLANAVNGGANILVYIMGKGLEFYIQRGTKAGEYKTLMTDIVNKSEAEMGHITINSDGSMNVEVQPFSTLDFVFQYHAPSHIAGNNLPGFAIVRD